MKNEIVYPNGYPYILYKATADDRIIGLGVTKHQVYSKYMIHRKKKLEPVSVTDLISKLGHKEAHQILKQYGENWCVARGMIFYASL